MASSKPSIDELKAFVYKIAIDYHQWYYEISCDWNKYYLDEHIYLRNHIGYALYGTPEYKIEGENDIAEVYVYEDEEAMKLIDLIYNKIVEHGTQLTEDEEVLCSALYCCIYDDSSLLMCDIDNVHECIQIIPVFKIQKAIEGKNKNVKDVITYQNWYIDSDARVYKSWDDYLSNNKLPKCTMISPKNGVYQADLREVWSDDDSPVWVEVQRNSTSKKITKSLDIASTVVSVGCIGITAFNPISPLVLAAGSVSGIWSGSRAVGKLIDRGRHDESISIVNKQALPAWLGVAGSTLGLAASGGSALLSRAIRAGTSVGKGTQMAHDAIVLGNLFVNSVGAGYNGVSILQKYRETGEISAKDIFSFTTHVLFICNSAVNMRLASDIIQSNQDQILQEYGESLRNNRHRKEFCRLIYNTGKEVVSEGNCNEHIIRSITKINNRNDFCKMIVKNLKIFAPISTNLSLDKGQALIFGGTLIPPSLFASVSKNIQNFVNQMSSNTLTSNFNFTTDNSSPSHNFISANVLKAGISTVRNFFVQQAMEPPSEVNTTKNYKTIINDLQNVKDYTRILQLLLKSGMRIASKIMNQNYGREEALQDTTNFIWQYVKTNFARVLPDAQILNIKYESVIYNLVEKTYDYVKFNVNEWIKAYIQWKEKKFDINQKQYPIFEKMDKNEKQEVVYNDITLIDPIEVMALSKEMSTTLVEETLIMTGSKMQSDERLPRDLIKLCDNELNDFFAKYPTKLEFKHNDLSKEFKGILLDLRNFEKKDIIFYKLLVISMNILQELEEDCVVKKDILTNVVKCLWIFVNVNFTYILPNTCMFSNEFESTVINIIIAIYRYQKAEPSKWSSAFFEYQEKYC